MSMENSASGSKDVDYDEETKITSGVSQKNISRKANGRNPSNVAESKDRDRENPPSPLQKEVEKEESGAPKSRRKRNEVSNSSVSSGGGWMSTSSGISNVVNKISNTIGMDDEDPKENPAIKTHNREKHLQEDGDEIMLIPDLDEEGGADSDQRIAHAPRNVNRKIPTLAELENDIKKTAASGSSPDGDGFNLSILLNTLVPSTMVLEADVAWSFESLLREVTDELSNTPKTVISSTITAVLSSLDNGNNLSITAGSKQPSILPNGKQPNNNGNAMSPSLNKLRGEKKKM